MAPGFVYLSAVAPEILQDVRNAGYHNFVGRPLAGYDAAECVLTRRAAEALVKAQRELAGAGLTLRVYDCYHPRSTVADVSSWGKNSDAAMQAEFYPNVAKAQLAARGYLASLPRYTRGNTVDATVERLPAPVGRRYVPGAPLRSCAAPFLDRFHDGSIDMGTEVYCMDPLSRTDAFAGNVADSHRALLRGVMERHGFRPDPEAWWRFTLAVEPDPNASFDFPIEPR
ncbi:MAG TPA: M15 family metallopeptidase [Candidatus Acidoferrales bacterium]|nr:M15 family metallopeptidase [Candidatus Acidoferrales bacterium]